MPLTLFAGRQEGLPACKKLKEYGGDSNLPGARLANITRCRVPAVTVTTTINSYCRKSQNVLTSPRLSWNKLIGHYTYL